MYLLCTKDGKKKQKRRNSFDDVEDDVICQGRMGGGAVALTCVFPQTRLDV